MKKLGLILGIGALSTSLSYAQLVDEKNVTVTMDLQPVLQLNMTTPDQIAFVFDEIREYYGGILKYGATILKVSSSVSWDLYAVGHSQNGTFWDQQMAYSTGGGPNSKNTLPLSLLELHQYPANPRTNGLSGTWLDYSTPFAPANAVVPGQNSVYYTAGNPYVGPAATEKYIAGAAGFIGGGGDAVDGGSFLTAGSLGSNYYYVLDYRILPGLPAIFPAAGTNAGAPEDLVTLFGANSYAQPGVYTMNVKYVLMEDQ
ncbi:MAG: hypothetical protein N3F62_02340 [Bacteroidia bacterium]|nr:hypothetical protein [Bacteroidia bacterium]